MASSTHLSTSRFIVKFLDTSHWECWTYMRALREVSSPVGSDCAWTGCEDLMRAGLFGRVDISHSVSDCWDQISVLILFCRVNSTGIPHILEHSVLCGSRKYPLKEPFVELLKGSLQTFLNAFTYPDRTCYPVASTNLQVFLRFFPCHGAGACVWVAYAYYFLWSRVLLWGHSVNV